MPYRPTNVWLHRISRCPGRVLASGRAIRRTAARPLGGLCRRL